LTTDVTGSVQVVTTIPITSKVIAAVEVEAPIGIVVHAIIKSVVAVGARNGVIAAGAKMRTARRKSVFAFFNRKFYIF
jgi:hypothetical protein